MIPEEFIKQKFEITDAAEMALIGYGQWLQAMKEYAAQESADFHDWMRRKMRDERHESVFRIIPEIGGTYHGSDGIRYTTSDLYAIYLKEKGGEGL